MARTPPPNLTSRMVYLKIEREIGNRFIRLPFGSSSENSKDYLQPILPNGSMVQVYNAVKTRARNSSGITCKIETLQSIAVFTADHHYEQVKNHITQGISKENEIFVVPHHGGIAGKVLFPNIGMFKKTAVVSVGKNQHGHPKDSILKAIETNGYSRYVTMFHEKDFAEDMK